MPRPSPLAFARYVSTHHKLDWLPVSYQAVDLCLYVLQGHSPQEAADTFRPSWSGLNSELVQRLGRQLLTEVKRLSRSIRQPWPELVNLKGPNDPLRFRKPGARTEEDFKYVLRVLRHLRKISTGSYQPSAPYIAK